MTHARRQILNAFDTALTVNADLHRQYSFPRDSAVQAVLTWGSESVERVAVMGSCEQSRELEVTVHLVATDTSDVAGILEAAAATAETELYALSIGDKAYLTGANLTIDDQGERPVGNLSMTYAVIYRTNPQDPETIL